MHVASFRHIGNFLWQTRVELSHVCGYVCYNSSCCCNRAELAALAKFCAARWFFSIFGQHFRFSFFLVVFFSWIFTRNTWDVDDEADETEADGRLRLPGAQQRGDKRGKRLLFFHIWTGRQKLIELQVHRRRRRRRRWQHLIKPRSQVEDVVAVVVVVADAHKPQQCVEQLKTETIERRRTAKQTKQTDDDDDNTDANDSFDMQISHANRVEDTRFPLSLSLFWLLCPKVLPALSEI